MADRPTKGRPVSPTLPVNDIYLDSAEPASLPSAPQMAVSSLATRPRSYLTRAGSLIESKLTANASRRSEGPIRKDSYDSSEWPS